MLEAHSSAQPAAPAAPRALPGHALPLQLRKTLGATSAATASAVDAFGAAAAALALTASRCFA